MPVETDVNNLLERLNSLTEGLDPKIKNVKAELDTLIILRERRDALRDTIKTLHINMDNFLDDIGGLI